MAFVLSIADTLTGAGGNLPFEGYNPPGDGADFSDIDNPPRILLNPLPSVLTIERLAAYLSAVAAGNLPIATRLGATLTAGITIAAGQQGAAGDVSVTLAQPTGAGDLQTVKAQLVDQGTEAVSIRILSGYSVAAPDDDYSVIVGGFTASKNLGATLGNADFYQALGSNDGRIVETQVQLRWPAVPGTFKYLLGVSIHSDFGFGAPTVRFRLRVDGATGIEAVAAAVASNPGFALNDVDTVHVAGGELVNFAAHHDGPYGSLCRVMYAIGFLPD